MPPPHPASLGFFMYVNSICLIFFPLGFEVFSSCRVVFSRLVVVSKSQLFDLVCVLLQTSVGSHICLASSQTPAARPNVGLFSPGSETSAPWTPFELASAEGWFLRPRPFELWLLVAPPLFLGSCVIIAPTPNVLCFYCLSPLPPLITLLMYWCIYIFSLFLGSCVGFAMLLMSVFFHCSWCYLSFTDIPSYFSNAVSFGHRIKYIHKGTFFHVDLPDDICGFFLDTQPSFLMSGQTFVVPEGTCLFLQSIWCTGFK